MNYRFIPLLCCFLTAFSEQKNGTERISIPISKPAVLHFQEEIIDVELGK